VREVLYLMVPRIITLGSVQFADLVIIFLTSRETGNTSGYFYGYYLMQLPETLIGTAIAIVVFPTMAELYNAGDLEGLKRTSMSALRIIWTLTIPAAVGMVLLGRPLIELFLGGGAFDAESIQLVYGILVFFSFRVISEASLEILARLFYAQHDTYTPMFVSLIWLALSIVLAFPLYTVLGVRGLALASTIAFTVQAIILFILNRRRLGYLQERELAASAARSLLGAVAMTAAILMIGRLISNTLIFMIVGGTFGVLAYFGVTYITGGREIPNLINIARNRPID
jgi:putative peptidoglycan lipid II flippase